MKNSVEGKDLHDQTEHFRIRGLLKLWKLARVADTLDMPLSTAYEHARTGLFDDFIVRIGRQVRADPEKFKVWLEAGGKALDAGWRKERENV